ncbi:MAG: hypothetical protein K5668_05785 [Lachnospiraceae bacterium]|nr:hypothetical protein [Lachnospiraceae bacterium]
MIKRQLSGSLFGLDRAALHRTDSNPFIRVILDRPVDKERMEHALFLALSYCPYIKYSVKEDEGIFLSLEENERPLPLLEEEPVIINSEENNGHSAAVCCRGDMIGVYVAHALTDGCGVFWFVRTLLDRYFGEEEGIYRGASQTDYDSDPMMSLPPLSEDYKKPSLPGGPYLTIPMGKKDGFKGTFLFQAPYRDFKALCKKLNGSAQNVLTLLGIKALSKVFPDNEKTVSARIPINARNYFGIPNSFQNASLANMRVCIPGNELKDTEDEILLEKIAGQCTLQNTMDTVLSQYHDWHGVLFAADREERMKRIIPLAGQDSIMISHLGRGLVADSYEFQIKAAMAGALLFPLMMYSYVVGDRILFYGYDAGKQGEYKEAFRSVLERRGIGIEEFDPAAD